MKQCGNNYVTSINMWTPRNAAPAHRLMKNREIRAPSSYKAGRSRGLFGAFFVPLLRRDGPGNPVLPCTRTEKKMNLQNGKT